MNIRAFKKHERLCMRKLIKLGIFTQADFTIAEGDEAMSAPTTLPSRHQHHGFINDGVLRGVPVVWETVGYYEPESDCRLPSEVLDQYHFVNDTDREAIWEAEAGG
jgi:hypothetical protein